MDHAHVHSLIKPYVIQKEEVVCKHQKAADVERRGVCLAKRGREEVARSFFCAVRAQQAMKGPQRKARGHSGRQSGAQIIQGQRRVATNERGSCEKLCDKTNHDVLFELRPPSRFKGMFFGT